MRYAYLLRYLCTLCLGLLLGGQALAQAPKTMVRASLQGKGPFVAGQQVRLNVDALTTTWFTRAPNYPQISAPNAVINLLDESASNLNATIGGEQWFGVSRAYLVTPTGSGDIVIVPFELTLYPGQGKGPVKVKTREIRLAVKVVARPAGAEGMLASSKVQISQKLDRSLDDIKVGDAFTRSIEVQAAGAQGMFIPPTSFPAVKGLAVYPKTGVLNNIIKDRVGFLGSHRIDAATYVIQKEGSYELPEVHIDWWNTRTGKPEKATVPALHFKASPNPGYKPEFGLPQEGAAPVHKVINWHYIGLLACLALLVFLWIYALWRFFPPLWGRMREWQHARQLRYAASEPAAYKHFAQAAQRRDKAEVYAALLAWSEHPDQPAHLRGLDALCRSTPLLAEQVDALRASLYGNTQPAWHPANLLQAITQLRQAHQPAHPAGRLLQPLNPT